jgi:hypothetical protein
MMRAKPVATFSLAVLAGWCSFAWAQEPGAAHLDPPQPIDAASAGAAFTITGERALPR